MANIAVIRGFDGKTRSGGTFLSILITFGLSFAIWAGLGVPNGWSPLGGTAIAWFAFAGILTIFVGRVFLYASIQHVGAVRASAIKRLNPIFSVLLGVVLLGESVNGPLVAGMTLICASFACWYGRRSRPIARARTAEERGKRWYCSAISDTYMDRYPHLPTRPVTWRGRRLY